MSSGRKGSCAATDWSESGDRLTLERGIASFQEGIAEHCALILQNLVYKLLGQLLSNDFHSLVKNILSRRDLDPLLLHLLKLGSQGHCGEHTASGEKGEWYLLLNFGQILDHKVRSPLTEKIF